MFHKGWLRNMKMMMRSSFKHRIAFWLAFMFCCNINAQEHITQKVIMNSGSEYEGYISSQVMGSNTLLFKSYCSTIVLNKNKYKNVTISTESVESSELSQTWKMWATKNKAFTTKGNREIFQLSTIIADEKELHNVHIKEIGEKIKYVTMNEETLRLSLDSISEIKGILRPDTILSGLDRVYELKNGNRNSGQYYGEIPKKTVKLLSEDGQVSINKIDIVKCIVKPVNKEQDIFEQSPLLDIVKMNGGQVLKGIVTEQNFVGNNQKDWFYTLMLDDKSMKILKFDDIKELAKEKNYGYKPVSDYKMKKGEYRLNDSLLIMRDLNSQSLNETSNYYGLKLKTDSANINIRKLKSGQEIVLQTNLGNEVKSDQFIIVPITKHDNNQIVNKKKSKIKDDSNLFDYELELYNILAKNIQPVKRTGPTKNGTTSFMFTVRQGDYILLDFVNLKYIILIIDSNIK